MRNCIHSREKSNTQEKNQILKKVWILSFVKKRRREKKLGHWSKENTHQYLIDDVSVDNGRRDEIEGLGGGGVRKLIKYL